MPRKDSAYPTGRARIVTLQDGSMVAASEYMEFLPLRFFETRSDTGEEILADWYAPGDRPVPRPFFDAYGDLDDGKDHLYGEA